MAGQSQCPGETPRPLPVAGVRIIAGRWKGHGLKSVKGRHVRPTTDRVRESWFSALGGSVVEARVVDLFAVVSGTSERHVKAVADEVELQLKRDHYRPVLRREGTPESGWILLDYGDIVVHVFHSEDREVFDLERLWSDVPRRDPESGEVTDPGRLEPREQRDDLLVEG